MPHSLGEIPRATDKRRQRVRVRPLTPTQAIVLALYDDGQTLAQIAHAMGLTNTRGIRGIVDAALAKVGRA